MSHKRIWLITGASRGMGFDFARAALAAASLTDCDERRAKQLEFWKAQNGVGWSGSKGS